MARSKRGFLQNRIKRSGDSMKSQSLTREKILVGWSGGKDSSMMLYELQKSGRYEIEALLTTVTETYDRISMHGVRNALLERQAEALRIPLCKVGIPTKCSNEIYEAKMREVMERYQSQGINSAAFGDLYLQDIREYREKNLARIGMTGIFPIWKRDTTEILKEFLNLGFKAVVCCVNPKLLDPSFAGRIIDKNFMNDLPSGVDPCGENGEYHSFVFDGPIFKEPVPISIGPVILRDSFYFCDLEKS